MAEKISHKTKTSPNWYIQCFPQLIASFHYKNISKTTVKIISHATNMQLLLQYFCSVLYCASLCAKASHWSLDECSIHLLLGSEMPLSIMRCHECILCVQFLSFYTCVIPHISLVVWKRCHENQTLKSLYDSKYWFYNTRYAMYIYTIRQTDTCIKDLYFRLLVTVTYNFFCLTYKTAKLINY